MILKCQSLYIVGGFSYFLKSDMVNYKTTRPNNKNGKNDIRLFEIINKKYFQKYSFCQSIVSITTLILLPLIENPALLYTLCMLKGFALKNTACDNRVPLLLLLDDKK